jgi:hypothetical protein
MIQKHRISTNIGKDQKITVELKQDFDVLEILSLKFSQQEIYTSMCSDYGVVCGRITANDGFGIPNVRVSIFVKQKDSDVDDPVVSKLYPYKDTTMRNDDNIRYNLLPKRQQHGGHTPVGTFPDQSDILTREEVLEVYESYYRFTVKTNESGDFMIWGVPIGEQRLHVDVDLSDIGCFSLRPYDFIKKGKGVDEFDRFYKFKSSTDIDGLPQIITFDKIIQVYPFWGNEEMCEIGITRSDFDISETGVRIEPISLILASSITDDDSDAVKRSGVIRRKTGYKCNLQTTTGKIECVRQTGRKVYGSDGVTLYPELQYYNITETINENGTAMVVLPMNLEYVFTNEFGEQELTNDHNKGIPTTAVARFRFSLDANGVKTGTANYLIPQIREFNDDIVNGGNYYGEYEESFLTTYQFSNVFEDYLTIPQTGMTFQYMGNSLNKDDVEAKRWRKHKTDLMLGTCGGCEEGVPQDVFYKFIFGKVYAPSSFQGSHYEVSAVESFLGLSRRDAFLGIKEIRPNVEDDCTSSTNYFPTNFAFKNKIKFGLIISEILLFLQYIFTLAFVWLIEIIGSTLWSVARFIGPLNPPFGSHPFQDFAYSFIKLAYNICEAGQLTLPLTTYPDCEECTSDVDTVDPSNNSTFNIEEGCKKYDKFYNESIVYAYIWSNDGTYGTNDTPSNTGNKSGPDANSGDGGLHNRIRATYDYASTNNPWFLLGKPYYPSTPNFKEQLNSPGAGWTIVAAIVGAPGAIVNINIPGTQYDVTTFNTSTRRLPNKVHNEAGVLNYTKKTKSGLTEIRDGVITIVPVVDGPSNSIAVIQEWYKRKRVGVFFCGGVTNYSFIDNWLHGILYFFKFDKKIKWDNKTVRDLNQRGSKFPRELVFFNVLDEAFYYRSTPYNPDAGFLGQIYRNGDNSVKYKEILRPTTFYDVGVRDEFLYEICQDPRIDPTCSVIRDITTTSYQDPANIVEHAINYRLDISDAKFDVDDFFTGQGLGDNVGVFDGDITQMMSINCEAGIEAFDLDSPQYFLYNGELMDPEDSYFESYFKSGGSYGPLPIDLKLDPNGAFIRQCLNFRLGDYSQKVPFFLWDKLGEGFGSYNVNFSDKQGWDRKEIASMKLQRLFSISDKSSTTSNYVMKDGEEEYLLKPMTIEHLTFAFSGNTTNALERYEVVSLSAPTGQTSDLFTYSGATDYVEGDLWLHVQSGFTPNTSLWTKDPASGTTYVVVYTGGTQQWLKQVSDVNGQSVDYIKDFRESFIYQTVNNYTGTKQVLSTPFLFYFGLRPQNSAVDLLIKYYGPKGAFPSAE